MRYETLAFHLLGGISVRVLPKKDIFAKRAHRIPCIFHWIIDDLMNYQDNIIIDWRQPNIAKATSFTVDQTHTLIQLPIELTVIHLFIAPSNLLI